MPAAGGESPPRVCFLAAHGRQASEEGGGVTTRWRVSRRVRKRKKGMKNNRIPSMPVSRSVPLFPCSCLCLSAWVSSSLFVLFLTPSFHSAITSTRVQETGREGEEGEEAREIASEGRAAQRKEDNERRFDGRMRGTRVGRAAGGRTWVEVGVMWAWPWRGVGKRKEASGCGGTFLKGSSL